MMEQQVPERRLSDEARARRRTELMEAIASEQTAGRRWLAPVAAAAVVAGLVGGGYVVTRIASDDPAPRPDRSLDVAGSGTATGSTPPAAGCESGDITTEELERSLRERARTPLWEDPAVQAWLTSYRDILARHLDSRDRHLERRVTNIQGGGSPECGFEVLGTKLGWSVPGEDGLGMVQVEVSRSRRDSQVQKSLDRWSLLSVTGMPGIERAEAAHDGDRFAVLVTRDDGVVVGIIADPLFGNNSSTPVSGFGFDVDDLLVAAADPEFALP